MGARPVFPTVHRRNTERASTFSTRISDGDLGLTGNRKLFELVRRNDRVRRKERSQTN